MFKVIIVAVIVVVAAVLVSASDSGSYRMRCEDGAIVSENWEAANCIGAKGPTVSVKTNECKTELLIGSWKAVCNSTIGSYENFFGRSCSGHSVLTRSYRMDGACRNCKADMGSSCKCPAGSIC